MVMGEPGREEYKIQSFDAETQQLLKTALKGEHGRPPELYRMVQSVRPGDLSLSPECPAVPLLSESRSK